jgi:methylated-DNA-protein-cysteine methyltransferase related protein
MRGVWAITALATKYAVAMTPFEQAVRDVLLATRPGEVLTYGEVAAEAGYPGAARAVGNYLRRTGDPVPWYRVVGAGDRIVSRCAVEQAERLRAEGLTIDDGRVRRPATAAPGSPARP